METLSISSERAIKTMLWSPIDAASVKATIFDIFQIIKTMNAANV
jgi:hypothetical protein